MDKESFLKEVLRYNPKEKGVEVPFDIKLKISQESDNGMVAAGDSEYSCLFRYSFGNRSLVASYDERRQLETEDEFKEEGILNGSIDSLVADIRQKSDGLRRTEVTYPTNPTTDQKYPVIRVFPMREGIKAFIERL